MVAVSSAQLLVVLIGIPGSGKSTLANALLAASRAKPTPRPWRRVSQDVLGSRGRCINAAKRALEAGENVLIDRCNFDAPQRAHWLGLSEYADADLQRIAVFLPISRAEARSRILARGVHEGGVDAESMDEEKIAKIIARMHGSLRLPEPEEGFDEVLRASGRDELKAILRKLWSMSNDVG